MTSRINQIDCSESISHKNENPFDNVKKAINKVLDSGTGKKIKNTTAAIGIALSTTIAPFSLTSCHDDLDTTPPKIEIIQKNLEISGGEILRDKGNQTYVGNTLIFRCSDDVTSNPSKTYTFNGEPIFPGYEFEKSGTIGMQATDESGNQSIVAKSQITKKETAEKPKCSLHIPEITISEGDTITQKGKDIIAGTQKIFAWESDDYIFSTNVDLPYPVSNNIDITFSLSIKGGQPETRTTKIKVNEVDNNKAPEVTREYPQDKVPNILGGVTVKGDNNQLTFGDVVMYTGKDDNTEVCTISLKLNDEEKIGKKISESSTYILTYTDKDGKSSSPIEFPVISESVDLTNLNLNMQVNQEVDLLEGIKVPSGIEITKVEVEINGQRQEVKAKNGHYLYTPNQPGTCYIYVTEKGEFGNTYVEKSKNPLTIKDIEHPEYQTITINSIKPVDVFPQISKIQEGDPNIYEYIKDLGVAEAYVMRDMMTKYGTGKYSPEQYQKLLSRMNIGLINEVSYDYENHGRIGAVIDQPYVSDHARYTYQNLTNFKGGFTNIRNIGAKEREWGKTLSEYAKAHPNDLFIFSCSATPIGYSKTEYDSKVFNKDIVDLCDLPNVIIFMGGGDTQTIDGAPIKKVYNGTKESNGDGMYDYGSMANSDENNYPNSNMRTIIGSNDKGEADMTNSQGSVVPVGFNKKSLVSGHPILPFYMKKGKLFGEDLPKNGTYVVSFTTPTVANETELCFGLCPDVKDANKLLEIIEGNTAKPDHISLNGQRWEIQKYSPINVAKAVCIDVNIPSTIKPGEIVTLTNKGYLGSIISIPGAEVKINGQWVAYDKSNESLIKSQNPMYFKEWRLNGDLVAKYAKNGTVTGKIIAVDDKRNGLNVEKEITIRLDTSVQ